MHVKAKEIIHHGVEACAYIAIGTWAVSSFPVALASYSLGKITYLGTKKLLNENAPHLSLQANRSLRWGASLLTGGLTLQTLLAKETQQAMNIFAAMGTTLGVTAASLGCRIIGDKIYKYLHRTSPQAT